MKKSTINFIKRMLRDELDREIVQDSPAIEEVEYVQDLIEATRDFVTSYGEPFEYILVEEQIDELKGGK